MKRSIGHLCHDELLKGAKNDLPGERVKVKQEESLPYLLGPAVDQQQADKRILQDVRSRSASEAQTSPGQGIPPLSNPMTQSQVFANSTQQCERHTLAQLCFELILSI